MTTSGRRSGPEGEPRWWDLDDQRLVERALLDGRDLGRGWRSAPMVNNVERLDPLGSDEASALVRAEREARRLTALDEGRAWRKRSQATLAVLRAETFAEVDDTAHRTAWRTHGAAALGATWRERWLERDREPGWIEAVAVPPTERPDPLHAFAEADPAEGAPRAVDWFRLEDHTGGGEVTCYQHVTMWVGRGHLTLIVRHDLGDDLGPASAAAAAALHRRWSQRCR